MTAKKSTTTKDIKDWNMIIKKEIQEHQSRYHSEPQPWYKSFGVWLAILLVTIMIYLIYIFYMSETGHTIKIPDILNRTIHLK